MWSQFRGVLGRSSWINIVVLKENNHNKIIWACFRAKFCPTWRITEFSRKCLRLLTLKCYKSQLTFIRINSNQYLLKFEAFPCMNHYKWNQASTIFKFTSLQFTDKQLWSQIILPISINKWLIFCKIYK